eukprot:CAMPEP_0172021866 /NCGR_PEP_ID=MMETSP1041-20130122/13947_1 /TAXON_ID=464988 /ORGANISM="Hemiselmis andersenii, Strain CCMP439" /LENGTH=195 /DNA_ID=CAMNT_0012677233 /DNA_START=667 /DNA_END=1255 /DNA_ORIENTATION=+
MVPLRTSSTRPELLPLDITTVPRENDRILTCWNAQSLSRPLRHPNTAESLAISATPFATSLCNHAPCPGVGCWVSGRLVGGRRAAAPQGLGGLAQVARKVLHVPPDLNGACVAGVVLVRGVEVEVVERPAVPCGGAEASRGGLVQGLRGGDLGGLLCLAFPPDGLAAPSSKDTCFSRTCGFLGDWDEPLVKDCDN